MAALRLVYLEATEQHTQVVAVEEAAAVLAVIKWGQLGHHLEVADHLELY